MCVVEKRALTCEKEGGVREREGGRKKEDQR